MLWRQEQEKMLGWVGGEQSFCRRCRKRSAHRRFGGTQFHHGAERPQPSAPEEEGMDPSPRAGMALGVSRVT